MIHSSPWISQFDRVMMGRCLELARRAEGQTAPNPLVGAVVVKDGQILGEGFHPGAGQPHGEVFALREAGDQAQGATLYVNLEPCNHYGRTPPCTEAIIAAGIERVYVGMIDPDPRVSGGGVQRLQQAGIEVITGVEEEACVVLNEGFIHRVRYQRPLGILKYAMTLDGKIATTTGHSAWVSSGESRSLVHRLRKTCDAVIVGGNTVRRDNPHLTTRQPSQKQPLRVVMSRQLELPEEAHLWNPTEAPTLVLTESGANPDRQESLRKKGVDVVERSPLTPQSVTQYLYERGLSAVLWECGGTLAAQAIADGVIDRLMVFIAPKVVGGLTAPCPIGDLGITSMAAALSLERITWRQVGPDLLLEGYLPRESV